MPATACTLRGQRDRDAIRAALADGTIDALCSDHTAVTAAGKAAPFAQAQPGAPGWLPCCR